MWYQTPQSIADIHENGGDSKSECRMVSWYQAQDEKKSLRQIVISIPPGNEKASKFGILLFGAKYLHLMSATSAAGFFRTDDEPGPYLLVRGDGIASKLRGSPIRVALSFYHMKAGGLCAVFVDVDSPAIQAKLSRSQVLFEMIYGLDTADTKRLVKDALDREILHLCFAEGDGPVEARGGVYSSSGIEAQFDVEVPLPADCRAALRREWESILSYHASVPAARRDFRESGRQMEDENSQGEDPILPPPALQSSVVSRDARHNSRELDQELLAAAEAGDVPQIRKLLAEGADMNTKGSQGETPLHLATEKGHVLAVEALLLVGAEKDARDVECWTPLHFAAFRGQESVARLLIRAGADKNARDRIGDTPLHWAAFSGHAAVATALAHAGADLVVRGEGKAGLTPLHRAADQGQVLAVEALLQAGVDKDIRDAIGETPLHRAAILGHAMVVSVLVQADADKDARDDGGLTPLHYAAHKGHTSIVELLLQAGANTNLKDRLDHRTPLDCAALMGHTSVVEILRNAERPGSSPQQMDSEIQIQETGGIEPGMVRPGPKPELNLRLLEAAKAGNAELVIQLLAEGADKETKDDRGSTPLHNAAFYGHVSVARALLQAGADKDAKTKDGETPLHSTSRRGQTAIAAMLIEAGADVDARADEMTPLHFAALTNSVQVVELLVKAGADVNANTEKGITPLRIAAGSRHTSVVDILRNAAGNASAQAPVAQPASADWYGVEGPDRTETKRKGRAIAAEPLKDIRLRDRQLKLRDQILALPFPPEDSGNDREWAMVCNKIAGHMASIPYALHVMEVPKLVQRSEDYPQRRARIRILSEMAEHTSAAIRDPLNFYTVDEIRTIVADGDNSFHLMAAVQSALEALYLSPGMPAAETTIRDFYLEHTLNVQAGLLLAYFSNARTKAVAFRYLVEWFGDCDVRADHAVLGACFDALKARGLEEHEAKTVEELFKEFQSWKDTEGTTLRQEVDEFRRAAEQREREEEVRKRARRETEERKRSEDQLKRRELDERKRREDDQRRTMETRRSSGLCVMCGKPMGAFGRILGRKSHSECRRFAP